MTYKLDSISDEEAKRRMDRKLPISTTPFVMRRIRDEIIEECARIAFNHNGISPKDSRDIAGKIRNLKG